jgi:glucokinase
MQEGVVGPIGRLKTGEFEGPVEAIEAFLDQAGAQTRPSSAALAVAGPVSGESARLTNGTWRFRGEELRASLGLDALKLVNDFAAVALALPHLAGTDLVPIGLGRVEKDAPCVVMGPGTGLGVAALLTCRDKPIVVASEGGHVTLGAHNEREREVLNGFRDSTGHVAAEDVLSGPGLVRLYDAIAALEGNVVSPRQQEEITGAALAGECDTSRAALDLFCMFLGRFAGDVALMFGARAGVYLAGGIVPSFVDFLKRSPLRGCFEDKGAFANYLRDIPIYVVTRPDPAFLGLAYLVDAD